MAALIPVFKANLISASYGLSAAALALDGTALASDGDISYQWQSSSDNVGWANIQGETVAAFLPPTDIACIKYYRVIATNTGRGLLPGALLTPSKTLYPSIAGETAQAISNAAEITVVGASAPVFSRQPLAAAYDIGGAVTPLFVEATAPYGDISYQWQSSADNVGWSDIPNENSKSYTPTSAAAGKAYYRAAATNTVGSSVLSSFSYSADITIFAAVAPKFEAALVAASYYSGDAAKALNGTAASERGTISYQWYSGATPEKLTAVLGASAASFTPPTKAKGTVYYQASATNTVGTSTACSASNIVGVMVLTATPPVFNKPLVGADYDAGALALAFDGTACAPNGTVSYRWFGNGNEISGAVSALYTPSTGVEGSTSYFVTAKNTVGDTEADGSSNSVSVTVYFAKAPIFSKAPISASYIENGAVTALSALASAERGSISYQWQCSTDGVNYSDISGAVGTEYVPISNTAGTFFYRVSASNTVGTSSASAFSEIATVKIISAEYPTFSKNLISENYVYAQAARLLDGTAAVLDGGTVSYQWFRAVGKGEFAAITGAVSPAYRPETLEIGSFKFYVSAKNTKDSSARSSRSNIADIRVIDTRLSENEKWGAYLAALKTNFVKLCRLDFLQPDSSIAFSLDNNPKNKRSGAFIQSGNLSVNLQNGQRRRGNILLSNLDGAFDFNVNRLWFGQRVRLMMGLRLPDGSDYYIPQGVFYLSNPRESFLPGTRTMEYELLDKWAYLDGTLFGNLDGIYEIALNENIFTAIAGVLKFDRGNGERVDSTPPIFTEYYRDKTVTLPNGTTLPVTNTPYTYRCDSTDGTYADIILEMNTMLAGIIGYDRTGQLRLDTSDEDVLDTAKPVLW
ncbi:MAG: hypothetical protein RR394_05380, partial [Oscillospiraceae bacterium]